MSPSFAEIPPPLASDLRSQYVSTPQPALFCRFDSDFRLTFANEPYCAWRGVPSDQLIGQSILDPIPEAMRGTIYDALRSVTPATPLISCTHPVTLEDGRLEWVEWTNCAIYTPEGTLREYQGIGRDVTEREQVTYHLMGHRNTLELANQRLHDLLETMQDAVFSIALPQRKIVFVSASFEAVFGYPVSEFIRDPDFFRRVVHPDDLPLALQGMETCLKNGRVELDHRIVLPDGRVRWLHRRAWVNYDQAGHPIQVNDSARDITARKLAEEALRASEEKYRSLIESSDAAISMVDADGRYLYLNPISAAPFGVPAESLVGKTVFDFFSIPEAESILRDVRKVIADNAGMVLETQVMLPEKPAWFRTSIQPVRDATGIPYAALIHATGITEKKEAELSLRASEEKYRSLIESSDASIAMFDVKGQILFANTIAAQAFGIQPADMVGKNMFDFFPPQVAAFQLQNIQRVVQSGQGMINERPSQIDGEERWYRTSIQPVRDAFGNVTAGLIHASDITRFKAAELALRESEERFQQFMRYLPGAVFIKDETGRTVYCNEMYAQQLNKRPEDLIGKYSAEYMPLEAAQSMLEESRRVLESGQAHEFVNAFVFEGETHYWMTMKFPIPREGRSPLLGAFSLNVTKERRAEIALKEANDLLERRVAERTLQLEEERNLLRALIDTVPDFMYVKDIQHRMVLNNAAHARSLGFDSPSEAVGKTDFELFPQPLALKFHIDEQDIFTTGEAIVNVQERSIGEDGTEIWALTTKIPLRNLRGELIGLVGITRDISEMIARQTALRESEERYRATLSALSEGIVMQDIGGAIRLCNAAAERILGLTADQMMGRTSIDPRWRSIHDDGSPFPGETHPGMITLRTGEPQYNVIMGVHKPDDTLSWIEINSQPLFEANSGAIAAVVATFADITARRNAEAILEAKRQEEHVMQGYLKALHEATLQLNGAETLDQFYRAVVEQGVNRFGFERLGMVLYNPAEKFAFGTYGVNIRGEIVSQGHLRLPHDQLPPHFRSTLERDERLVLLTDWPLYEDYTPIRVGQQAIAALWNESTLGWLAVDNALQGRLLSAPQLDILALYGLTVGSLLARKRAEISLKESEEKFRQLIESAPIAILITDMDGNLSLINKAAETLFGYPREELINQSVDRLVPDERVGVHANHRTKYRAMPHSRPAGMVEIAGRHKDGHTFPIDVQLSHIDVSPSSMVMAFVTDISQRKAAEEALKNALVQEKELGELKSRFVSMASHEFRTPLTTILATTETLTLYRARMDDAQIDARLDKIRQQVNYMRDIMEDVLQLARIQAGRVEFIPRYGDLDALCRDIAEEFESHASNQGRIVYACSTAPMMAEFDPQLMRQVIINLVSNALKYSAPTAPVEITLTHDAYNVILKVQDRGIGIPAEDMKHLFEPFHRASNTGMISGTGLGLSIAHQAVKLHKGQIVPESTPGRGTVFIVSFPITQAKDS